MIIEITSHVCFPLMCKHVTVNTQPTIFPDRWELQRSLKVTFKVKEGHWCWCHSIEHVFTFSVPL